MKEVFVIETLDPEKDLLGTKVVTYYFSGKDEQGDNTQNEFLMDKRVVKFDTYPEALEMLKELTTEAQKAIEDQKAAGKKPGNSDGFYYSIGKFFMVPLA